MTAFIIRIVLALVAAFFNVYLFVSGHWGWGIFFIFITALIVLSFFRNENMILALNQMRVGNQDKAKAYINKITHPHLLPKKQHAYILYLKETTRLRACTSLVFALKQVVDQKLWRCSQKPKNTTKTACSKIKSKCSNSSCKWPPPKTKCAWPK